MPRKDLNILAALAGYKDEDKMGVTEKLIEKIQSFVGKPFVVMLQPGAGAPVDKFLNEWINAGLAGCTKEITECKLNLWYLPIIIVNTLTPEEQIAANEIVQSKTKVDVSKMTIINDPEKVLFKACNMSKEEMKVVNDRHAYVPQAWICRGDGDLHSVISREPEAYLEKIKNATLSLHPVPSYGEMHVQVSKKPDGEQNKLTI